MKLEKNQINNYKFIVLFTVGILARLTLASLPGFKIDVDSWYAWSARLNDVGLSEFYSPNIFTDYTPGYLYILAFLGLIKNIFSLDAVSFYYLLKLPAIISEVLMGYFVYFLFKNSSWKTAMLASLLILFNPALIFNSTIWGQVDAVLALFMILSVYFLTQQRLISASLMFGLAILIKPQTIALLPVFGLFTLKNFIFKKFNFGYILKLILPALIITLLLSLPFFPKDPFFGLINRVLETASQYAYTSLFAYNFWGMVGSWIPDNTKWLDIGYQYWGYVLLVIYWSFIAYCYIKKGLSLYSLAALATLSFFFLPTRVHERYLYPALIFLSLVVSYLKFKPLIYLLIILCLISLLDLYYVYVYYNEIYLNLPKLLYWAPLYHFLEDYSRWLSAASTAIFLAFTYLLIKYNHAKETDKH